MRFHIVLVFLNSWTTVALKSFPESSRSLKFLENLRYTSVHEYANELLRSYYSTGNETMKQAYTRCRDAMPEHTESDETTKPYAGGIICMYRLTSPRAVGFVLPKVASSSLRYDQNLLNAGFQTAACVSVFAQNPSLFSDSDVFRFSIIRDPLSRFVSAFNQISLETLEMGRLEGRGLLRPSPAMDPKERFSEFMEDVLTPGKTHSIVFTEPQLELLLQADSNSFSLPPLDFVISLDELDSQWGEMMKEFGISNLEPARKVAYRPAELSKVGRLETEEGVVAILENPTYRLAFSKLYASDFVCFGFNLPLGVTLDDLSTQAEEWPAGQSRGLSRVLNEHAAVLLHDPSRLSE